MDHQNGGTILGVLVDVSGSMQTSIGDSHQRTRLTQLRESMAKAVERAGAEERSRQEPVASVNIDLFAYLVGTQIPDYDVCDLRSLLRAAKQGSAPEPAVATGEGFLLLRRIASQYDRENWVGWAADFLTSQEAQILARELERDRVSARELADLLPKTQVGAGLSAAAGLIGFDSKVERAKSVAKELIARGGDVLQRRLEDIGVEPVLPLGEVSAWSDRIGNERWATHAEQILFGRTPLRAALVAARKRFDRERARHRYSGALLLILSDGEPTDGDPVPVAEELRSEGVAIISCLITSTEVVSPRTLFSHPQPHWGEGARVMFHMASLLPNESTFGQVLGDRGWEVSHGGRMFVQVNHPAILDQVLEAVLTFQ